MNRAFELAGKAIGLNEGEQKAALQDYLTTGGQNLDPATTAWCAAFVNSTLQQAGMQGTGKLNARSYLDWGQAVDAPERGDIAVFSRGDPNGWQGHVGFFDGYNEDGTIRVLGGNQGNAVSVASYSPNALLGFRRAEGEVGNALANTYTPASEGRDAQGNALNAFSQPPEPDRYAPALPQIGTFLDASAFQAPVSNALAAPQFSISPLSTRFR